MTPTIDKILNSIEIDGNGCWLWLRGCDPDGYGKVRDGARTRRTHIVTYEFYVGLVPDGLVLDHQCNVRGCCNPAHLLPMTNRENVLKPGSQSLAAIRAAQTHCIHGHEFTEQNTIIRSNGCRKCRTCWNRIRRERRRRAKLVSVSAGG